MQNSSIINVFKGFMMAQVPGDLFATVGEQVLDDKITKFVSQGKPIDFSMMGFPFKSINDRDKTIGTMPDLGEELTMQNFARFGSAIQEVYKPGIKLHVVSDGYVFNDLMDVPDSRVAGYEEITKEMAKIAPVQVYDVFDFYGRKEVSDIRTKIMEQFGITELELERRILMDADVNFLYKGMIRFMSADLAIKPFDSGNQLHKAAKVLARKMMFRNEAYSKLVQTEMSDKIRLSMHPSLNSGVKYSFQLINSPRAWTSPWHCAILRAKDGEVATIHRKDAEAAGYELVYQGGRPYYFIEN